MINRRQFLKVAAATGSVGCTLVFRYRNSVCLYQSIRAVEVAQPFAALAQEASRSQRPMLSQLPSRGSPTTPSPSDSSPISYTPASARRRCGATTRLWRWAVERSHRGTSAASSWPRRGHRSSSRLPTPPVKHILPVDTSANFPDAQAPERGHHAPAWWARALDQRRRPVRLVPGWPVRPERSDSAAGNIYKMLNPDLAGPGGVLLSQRPECPDGVVSRPRPRHHPAQCLCGHRQRLHHSRRLRGQPAQHGPARLRRERRARDSDRHPGQDLRRARHPQQRSHLAGPTGLRAACGIRTSTSRPLGVRRAPAGLPPDPSVVPEMFGDTMLANGTVYPEATVEARRYRLRILNACQARFLNLQLYVDDGSRTASPSTTTRSTPTNAKGPDFLVIGTEGGFLSSPWRVPSNRAVRSHLRSRAA